MRCKSWRLQKIFLNDRDDEKAFFLFFSQGNKKMEFYLLFHRHQWLIFNGFIRRAYKMDNNSIEGLLFPKYYSIACVFAVPCCCTCFFFE